MNIYTLTLSLLQCSFQLARSWNQDPPTIKYSMSYKDIPGDVRRRRQNARFKDSISMKPPPPDWPSPTLGAADFLYDEPIVTSVSPLQAYQAKLQEEYLKDMQERSQKKSTQTPNKGEHEASIWSSSDEDFKKLLDPNELLKLNKKLAPILSKSSKISHYLKRGLNHNDEKSDGIASLNKHKKSKKITTSVPIQQSSNENKVKSSDTQQTSMEHQKPRVKKKLKRKKKAKSKSGEDRDIKKRKKKARKFAFDIHRSSSDSSALSSASSFQSSSSDDRSRFEKQRKSVSKVSSGKSSSSHEYTTSSKEESTVTTVGEVYSFHKVNEATTLMSEQTSPFYHIKTTSESNTDSTTERTYTTSQKSAKIIETTAHVNASSRKMEVRKKRKQIKQEMEKILKEEQLEGSFGDADSHWTTSEEEFYIEYDEIRKSADRKIEALKKIRTTQSPVNSTTTPKFPINNLTPHQALLGILKHKIVNFVDQVLKSSLKEK